MKPTEPMRNDVASHLIQLPPITKADYNCILAGLRVLRKYTQGQLISTIDQAEELEYELTSWAKFNKLHPNRNGYITPDGDELGTQLPNPTPEHPLSKGKN